MIFVWFNESLKWYHMVSQWWSERNGLARFRAGILSTRSHQISGLFICSPASFPFNQIFFTVNMKHWTWNMSTVRPQIPSGNSGIIGLRRTTWLSEACHVPPNLHVSAMGKWGLTGKIPWVFPWCFSPRCSQNSRWVFSRTMGFP